MRTKTDPLSRITNAVWRWIDPVVAAIYNRGLTRARSKR